MVTAKAKWDRELRFEGIGNTAHTLIMDSDGKVANSPMDLVLIALCGCTAVDVTTILKKKREPFTTVEVSAEAEKAPTPPRVYTKIHLRYRVGGNVSRKAVDDAVRLSEEKYCSVAAMLHRSAKISYEICLDS
jgi:putative redox protein